VRPEDVLFKGASWLDMNELVPKIGIPERVEDVDEPLGRLRMAGRHFVLQKYVIVEEAYFFHSLSMIIRLL
jgi:hypothetical protein